ncbi:DUF4047 domain-containing protein [Rossellomorea sp. y25]|uniref:DUF4047 domain-containing protein n=1 Tax=Rossellomorea sp. y25 TaxID=3118174 RepID=UPI0030E09DC8
MRGRIHKTILLSSLCCMAFYAGTQLVGETEAAFSSRVSTDPITMSAAFVFPATIHELEERAQKVSKSMEHTFHTVVAPSPEASMEELHRQLDEVTAMKEELTRQLGTLQNLYDEVSAYHMDIQNQGVTNAHTYDYVREGFQHVAGMLEVVQATVDFSHIEAIRTSILLQIQNLEDQEKPSIESTQTNPDPETPSIEQPQTNPDPESSESQDEASTEITDEAPTEITDGEKTEINEETSTEITNDKQVTAHEEETVEYSQ